MKNIYYKMNDDRLCVWYVKEMYKNKQQAPKTIKKMISEIKKSIEENKPIDELYNKAIYLFKWCDDEDNVNLNYNDYDNYEYEDKMQNIMQKFDILFAYIIINLDKTTYEKNKKNINKILNNTKNIFNDMNDELFEISECYINNSEIAEKLQKYQNKITNLHKKLAKE